MGPSSSTGAGGGMAVTGSFEPSRIEGRDLKLRRCTDVPCLWEIDLGFVRKSGCRVVPAYIEGIDGVQKRDVVPVRIIWKKKAADVWCDWITGTLYWPNGECLTSYQRRIVAWYP